MALNNNAIGARLPSGFSDQALDTIFSSVPFPMQGIVNWHTYLQDFDQYVAGDWTVTETQAGATQALAAGNGGRILLTNSAGDDDVNQIQKLPASFLLSLTKQFWMSAIFQISDVIESDFAIGVQLANADGTDLAVATDGIFFLKADGAATLNLYVRKNNAAGSSVATAIATLVNATDIQLDVYYDGQGLVYYAVNGAVAGTIAMSADNMPDVIVSPIISLKNGEAVAKTANADRLFVALQR